MRIFFIIVLVQYSLSAYAQNNNIDSLQKLLQTQKEDTAKVNTLIALGREFRSSDTDTSLYFANAALTLATKLNYEMGIADSKRGKSALNASQGKFDEGIKYGNDALVIYNKLHSSATGSDKQKILEKIGSTYQILGHNTKSQGNYPEGLKYSLVSLKIREQLGDKKGIGTVEYNIGNFYYDQHNYPEALKHHYASLKINLQLGDKANIADDYNTIGLIFFAQGNYPEALKNYSIALKLAEKAKSNYVLAEIYNNLGVINEKQGNYNEALRYDFNALKLYEETGIYQALPWMYNSIGCVYMKQKRYNDASEYLNKALSFSKKIASLEYIKLSHENWATLDSAQGNHKKALVHYKLAVTYRDSLFNEENTKKTVQSQMQYDFDKKEDLLKQKQIITDTRLQAQRRQQYFYWGGLVILTALSFFVFLNFRNQKKINRLAAETHARQKAELQLQGEQAILNERLRISSELHDEVGATLSSISIFSQAAIQKNESGNLWESKNILERIGETSREVMGELNDTVWLINPLNDNLLKIIQRVTHYALPLCRTSNIHFATKAEDSVKNLALTVEKRKAIYLIIKEAVNNSLKYAAAKNLSIQFEKSQNALHVCIKDDGCGFSEKSSSTGNGLNNMKQRAKDVYGKIDFHSLQQHGTEIVLQVPLANTGG